MICRITFSQTITRTKVKAYLFYNLYIFDPFGRPLQLRLPQCVQIVQIQTRETWIRLEEEHFKWYNTYPPNYKWGKQT